MEVAYGTTMASQHDQNMLSAVLNTWIATTATRSDFEYYRAHAPAGTGPLQALSSYKMPSLNTRLVSMIMYWPSWRSQWIVLD